MLIRRLVRNPHEMTEGEIVRTVAEQRGITESEALALRAKERLSARELQRQLDERRRKAGNPVFKPKFTSDDFTGQVRRC